MPGDPKECRQHALRCLELAAKARSQDAKIKFVTLAATWQQIARELEEAMALIEPAEQRSPSIVFTTPSESEPTSH